MKRFVYHSLLFEMLAWPQLGFEQLDTNVTLERRYQHNRDAETLMS
jgi:hypothetical protein